MNTNEKTKNTFQPFTFFFATELLLYIFITHCKYCSGLKKMISDNYTPGGI